MSAFIVEDYTINAIVNFLCQDETGRYRHIFKSKGYDPTDSDDLERLARDLYLMNCDAVDQRYGKGSSAGDVITTFQFQWTPRASAVEIYKRARCLWYQCSEGDIPERHLYQMLDTFIRSLSAYIIETMPEYQATPWG